MIGEICAEIKNYFVREGDIHIGDWEVSGGTISPALDLPTDYFRIVGSRLNDGVHKVSELETKPLKNESFHGGIWIMSPTDDFLQLVEEIEAWQNKNGIVGSDNMSPFSSESFGGYSYSKASGGSSSSGSSVPTWKSMYASRLNLYRRIREL